MVSPQHGWFISTTLFWVSSNIPLTAPRTPQEIPKAPELPAMVARFKLDIDKVGNGTLQPLFLWPW